MTPDRCGTGRLDRLDAETQSLVDDFVIQLQVLKTLDQEPDRWFRAAQIGTEIEDDVDLLRLHRLLNELEEYQCVNTRLIPSGDTTHKEYNRNGW